MKAINLLKIASLISLNCFGLDISGTANFDSWNYSNNNQVRYLPNYSTADDSYKNSQTFNSIYLKANHDFDDKLSLKISALSTSDGNRKINNLEANYKLSDKYSIRAGILPFRVSQCRQFEDSNPWISEPDNFCKFHGLNEISEGAAGLQLGRSSRLGVYAVDVLAGYYDAEIDGQSDKLSIYVPVGHNKYNKKYGISIRATGSDDQYSIGILQTRQYQYDERNTKARFDRDIEYSTVYAGIEKDFNNLTIRATASGYIGEFFGETRPTKFYAISKMVEASYYLSIKTSLNAFYAKYDTDTIYYPDDARRIGQSLDVPSYGLSVRRDFDRCFVVIQYFMTKSDYRPAGAAAQYQQAHALGLRLGIKL